MKTYLTKDDDGNFISIEKIEKFDPLLLQNRLYYYTTTMDQTSYAKIMYSVPTPLYGEISTKVSMFNPTYQNLTDEVIEEKSLTSYIQMHDIEKALGKIQVALDEVKDMRKLFDTES